MAPAASAGPDLQEQLDRIEIQDQGLLSGIHDDICNIGATCYCVEVKDDSSCKNKAYFSMYGGAAGVEYCIQLWLTDPVC